MTQCGKPVDVSGYRFNVPAPVCTYEAGHDEQHPCGVPTESIGDRCRFCGEVLASVPCPDCWTPIPDNLADAKALLALGDFSVKPGS